MSGKAIVEIQRVNKLYGENHVVKDLNLDIYEGEFLSILGPSGCGKTTTLRMIAGFEEQTDGVILVEGGIKEPFERNVNTVFQSYALFPHLTVYDNVAYGLKMKKVKKDEIKQRVTDMLSMVQLTGFEKRYPAQLSGGQKQRVAIARAIINNPKVLLLDEPLGALDMKLRKQMQIELKNLQKKLGITFVYVTHDQEEALTMSDRIAVMNVGILEQTGAPNEIYEQPATKFVADFIGESNLFEVVMEEQQGDVVSLRCESGNLSVRGKRTFAKGEMLYLSVRPEKTLYSPTPVEGFSLYGVVKENIYMGTVIKSILELPNRNQIKISTIAGQSAPPAGSSQYIYWDLNNAVLMPSMSNQIYYAVENVNLGEYVEKVRKQEAEDNL
jgi:spermidine/putrescine transport system ATP-binding protein